MGKVVDMTSHKTYYPTHYPTRIGVVPEWLLSKLTELKIRNQGNPPKLLDVPQATSHYCQSWYHKFLNWVLPAHQNWRRHARCSQILLHQGSQVQLAISLLDWVRLGRLEWHCIRENRAITVDLVYQKYQIWQALKDQPLMWTFFRKHQLLHEQSKPLSWWF